MKKDLIQTIKIITLGFFFSAGCAFAWTAPLVTPPTPPASSTCSDPSSPIDVGSSSQVKCGGLATGPLVVAGVSNFYGNVSILAETTAGSTSAPADSGNTVGKVFNTIFSSFEKSTKSLKDSFMSIFSGTDIVYAASINEPANPCGDFNANNYGGPLPCQYDPPEAPPVLAFTNSSNPLNLNADGETSDNTPSFSITSELTGPINFYNNFSGGQFSYFTTTDTCSSTSTSVTQANTAKTITLNQFYNGPHTCIMNVGNGPYTNILIISFTVTGHPVPPIASSDLYVSGKVGVGVSSPAEALDVVGSVKVDSLAPYSYSVTSERICANTSGKLVSCTRGFQQYSSLNSSSYVFTVPAGVFQIFVCFSQSSCTSNSLYVLPGQQISVIFDKNNSIISFGNFFSNNFVMSSNNLGYLTVYY